MTNYKLSYAVMTKNTEYRQCAEAASLDRINCNIGYVAGNVRIVSWRYNFLEGPYSDNDLYEIAKSLLIILPRYNVNTELSPNG